MKNVVVIIVLLATLAFAAPPSGKGKAPQKTVANGDCNGEYPTINAALTAAVDGDTVILCPGEYTENVLIDNSITLRGSGKKDQRSTIVGDTLVVADNVKLDNIEFISTGPATDVVLVGGVSGITVTNCRFETDEMNNALTIADSSNVLVENNEFSLTSFNDGIYFYSSGSEENIVIRRNIFTSQEGSIQQAAIDLNPDAGLNNVKILNNVMNLGEEDVAGIVLEQSGFGPNNDFLVEGNKFTGGIWSVGLILGEIWINNLVVKNNDFSSRDFGLGVYWFASYVENGLFEGNNMLSGWDSIAFDDDASQCLQLQAFRSDRERKRQISGLTSLLEYVTFRNNKFTTRCVDSGFDYYGDVGTGLYHVDIVDNEFNLKKEGDGKQSPVVGPFWVEFYNWDKNRVKYDEINPEQVCIPFLAAAAAKTDAVKTDAKTAFKEHYANAKAQREALRQKTGANKQNNGQFRVNAADAKKENVESVAAQASNTKWIIAAGAAVAGLMVVAVALLVVKRANAQKYTTF